MEPDVPVAECAGALVVVVAYHAPEQLADALAPLLLRDVLVIDNSQSSAVRQVSSDLGVQYVDSGDNIGFARAVNLGIEHAGGRDVVLVNPDSVVTGDTIDGLVARLHRQPRIAAVAPAQVGLDGATQRVRWPFPTPREAWRQALGAGGHTPHDGGFVIGSVLALRADALHDVGPFDPSFFLYSEETDWQRRAVDRGWVVELASDLVAVHIGGGTSSNQVRREVHFHAGGERYIRKWFGTTGWFWFRTATVVGGAVRILLLRGVRREEARRRTVLHLKGPLTVERQLGRAR